MEKIWNAKWITHEMFIGVSPMNVFHKEQAEFKINEHRIDLKNFHMLVRKKFNLQTESNNAYIYITADDYYKLYINGEFIVQGPAPSYPSCYNYNKVDVSKYLNKGENIISIHVYYQGLINRVWNSGDYRQGMIAELFVNKELILCTDKTWKCLQASHYTASETIGYETQYLENIDSRKMEMGWKNIGFYDDHWGFACEKLDDDHNLVIQQTPALEVYRIKPSVIKKLECGHYFLDFGQEITGQFEMQAMGESGQIIEIRCGEEIIDGQEYSVRYDMRCNCKYQESWILSGEKDTLEFYDYKAFRYVEVIASSDIFITDSFFAIVRHYPFDKKKCKFESSNKLINKIWEICKNGVKYGSQEGYVDCPSREKGQYLGDVTVTAHAHLYLSGDLRLYKKTLKDFANSTVICSGIMAVSPGNYMQEIADYSLQWPLQLLTYYKQSGDIDFLKEMYPFVEGVLRYFDRYKRKDGLLEDVKEKWNLVDWPKNLRDGYDFDISTAVVGDGCHNVINAFYCGAVKIFNEIRIILSIKYFDELPSLKKAFIETFFNKETKLFTDSSESKHTALHSNAIPLFYGLVPDEAVKNVVNLIKEKGLNCGVYISYFLLKGLASVGGMN